MIARAALGLRLATHTTATTRADRGAYPLRKARAGALVALAARLDMGTLRSWHAAATAGKHRRGAGAIGGG
jgi:hypothetical protein